MQLDYDLPKGEGDLKRVGRVKGSTKGLLIADASQKHTGLTVVITNDREESIRLHSEVSFFSKPDTNILQFPDWETLPYDQFSAHQDIISERIHTLCQLPNLEKGILIVPVQTLMHQLAPSSYMSNHSLSMDIGQTLNIERLRETLIDSGYSSTESVYNHGEFSVRGSILDIYPTGSPYPYRIELFDDEIESLRTFDPETQRSIESIKTIKLLPAKEFPFDKDAISGFLQRWRDTFDVDYRNCPTYKDIKNQITPPGIEYYLPLFYQSTSTLFDYLPSNSQIILNQGLEASAQEFWQEVLNRYDQRRHDIEKPILEPNKLFLPIEVLLGKIKSANRLLLSEDAEQESAGRSNLPVDQNEHELTVDHQKTAALENLQQFLSERDGPVIFCAESAGRREALLELFKKHHIKVTQVQDWFEFIDGNAELAITVAPLERGINLPGQCHLITETQLFGRQVFQRRRRSREKEQAEQVIKNLSELNIGAPVVHVDHGVGRYQGLETITIDSQTNEFLMLTYANEAKLYVPVASLHLISRYAGTTDELAPLHKLGTEQWSKAKQKAAEKARDAAAELLDIYARRAARIGYEFQSPDEQYRQFAAAFPFEETPDQASAISAVIGDMTGPQPMDRLVCGDVGFGKTEVAMRAAFIAAQSNKQIAILVPTTLLAQQHYDNFNDRFADWPFNIALISRFRSGKQQNETLDKLASGQVDIVIGTHKLLQSDINFKNLGLLIIDEEHRFGVQQKEKLKSLRSDAWPCKHVNNTSAALLQPVVQA